MNKQRYLAELGQLLIFMTSADRNRTLHRFGELFDQAGPEGEQSLTEQIGTPTQNAIRLSRGYKPGRITDAYLFPDFDLDSLEDLNEQPASPSDLPEEGESSFLLEEEDFPDYSPPDLSALDELDPEDRLEALKKTIASEDIPDEEERKSTAPGKQPASGAVPRGEASRAPGREAASRRTGPASPPPGGRPAPSGERRHGPPRRAPAPPPPPERPMPLPLGISLLILSLLALGVPVAALLLVLLPVLLLPGTAVIGGAVLAAVGGLWCLQYVADAILMFGLAMFLLGLGLLILWAGFSADVRLVKLAVQMVRSLKHLFLGNRRRT